MPFGGIVAVVGIGDALYHRSATVLRTPKYIPKKNTDISVRNQKTPQLNYCMYAALTYGSSSCLYIMSPTNCERLRPMQLENFKHLKNELKTF